MGAWESFFSEVATSPRKAFSLAMRGGLKAVWAFWWYSKAIGLEPMICFYFWVWSVAAAAVLRRLACFDLINLIDYASGKVQVDYWGKNKPQSIFTCRPDPATTICIHTGDGHHYRTLTRTIDHPSHPATPHLSAVLLS